MIEYRFPNAEVDKLGAWLLNHWTSLNMIKAGMIGGSVRRMTALVKDLEIIVRPVMAEIPDIPEQESLFDKDKPLELKNASMFEEGLIEFLDSNPKFTLGNRDGPKYKVIEYRDGNGPILKIDCFIVPDKRAWGVQAVIRTGPGLGFNKPLMQWLREIRMHTSNGLLHDHPKYGKKRGGKNRGQCQNVNCKLILPCYTEEDFFNALQLPWIPPGARGSDTLTRAIAQRKRNLR